MALKWKELEIILSEARPLLEGSALQKVMQSGDFAGGEAMSFQGFGEAAGPWRLFLSLVKDNTCAALLPDGLKFDSAPEPTSFVMVLRKHLLGKRVRTIDQVHGERVFLIHFEGGYSLVVELIPKYGNLLLLEEWSQENNSGKCLGSFRKVSLETGAIYRLPPPPPASEGHVRDLDRGEGSYNSAVAEFYWQLLSTSEFESWKREWRQRVRASLKKMKSARDNAKSDLEQAQEAELFQQRGKALFAKLYELGPRALPKEKSITIDELVIPLDRAKNYADNAELLFKKAKKFTRAVGELAERMSSLEEKCAGLEALAAKVELAKEEEALLALSKDFTRAGLEIPERKQEEKKESVAKPYLEASSSDGFLILCGRNQEENRKVTFQESRGNDLWVHVKGLPGAHVVVKCQKNKTIPLTTLLEAAQLALYHSKIRKGKRAEVDYTQRKHVRAIKGTLAEVTYTGNKTLYVEADPEVIKRLMRS